MLFTGQARAIDEFLYTVLFVGGKMRKKSKIKNKHAKVTGIAQSV
jgi:hypothetical protein